MLEILGVNVMAEDIQRDPSQVQMVKEKGQVIFVWTDDQSDSGTVKYLKELGVDGIIYDRYIPMTFIFNAISTIFLWHTLYGEKTDFIFFLNIQNNQNLLQNHLIREIWKSNTSK